jgi:hypothetical protein
MELQELHKKIEVGALVEDIESGNRGTVVWFLSNGNGVRPWGINFMVGALPRSKGFGRPNGGISSRSANQLKVISTAQEVQEYNSQFNRIVYELSTNPSLVQSIIEGWAK